MRARIRPKQYYCIFRFNIIKIERLAFNSHAVNSWCVSPDSHPVIRLRNRLYLLLLILISINKSEIRKAFHIIKHHIRSKFRKSIHKILIHRLIRLVILAFTKETVG